MSFGREIKIRRVILGITQKELADRIGVGQTMISAYEKDIMYAMSHQRQGTVS